MSATFEGKPLILDGGLATELEARGCDISGPLWSARVLQSAPEAIGQLHYDYYAAGADCAITASYQASYEGFASVGLDDAETTRLLRLSVELARDARSRYRRDRPDDRRELHVAASVGPYGATTHDGAEYRGDYGLTVDELKDFHERRFDVLATAGADFLACETIPLFDEARAYVRLLGTRPNVRAWLSFTSPDGAHTSHGEPLVECARLVDAVPNVFAVGVNCVRPEVVGDAIRALKAGTAKPIVVYPNSGERWVAGDESWRGERGQSIPALAAGWVRAGARLVGGCCRVGPAEIAALAAVLAGRGIRPGTDADLPGIRRLLELGGLPRADLDTARPRFVVATEGSSLVGAAGLEILGATGLLRSVVVASPRRGAGLGRALVESVEANARQLGLRELVLLTETARDFFARLGYADIARADAPEAVRTSAEFATLCPQTAHCMRKRLDR